MAGSLFDERASHRPRRRVQLQPLLLDLPHAHTHVSHDELCYGLRLWGVRASASEEEAERSWRSRSSCSRPLSSCGRWQRQAGRESPAEGAERSGQVAPCQPCMAAVTAVTRACAAGRRGSGAHLGLLQRRLLLQRLRLPQQVRRLRGAALLHLAQIRLPLRPELLGGAAQEQAEQPVLLQHLLRRELRARARSVSWSSPHALAKKEAAQVGSVWLWLSSGHGASEAEERGGSRGQRRTAVISARCSMPCDSAISAGLGAPPPPRTELRGRRDSIVWRPVCCREPSPRRLRAWSPLTRDHGRPLARYRPPLGRCARRRAVSEHSKAEPGPENLEDSKRQAEEATASTRQCTTRPCASK